jgi:hypothetical protein
MLRPVILLNNWPAKWHAHHAGDRRRVADEIEVEMLIERFIGRDRRRDHEDGVAVGRRPHHRFGANIAASARPVLDDKLLAEPLRQPLPHQACENIGRASGCEADDQTHGPRRIRLRLCDVRDGRKCGSACCEMQKFPAEKLHDVSSRQCFLTATKLSQLLRI